MHAAGHCVVKADHNDVDTVIEQYTHVIGAYEIQYKARRSSYTFVQAHSSLLPLALVLLDPHLQTFIFGLFSRS